MGRKKGAPQKRSIINANENQSEDFVFVASQEGDNVEEHKNDDHSKLQEHELESPREVFNNSKFVKINDKKCGKRLKKAEDITKKDEKDLGEGNFHNEIEIQYSHENNSMDQSNQTNLIVYCNQDIGGSCDEADDLSGADEDFSKENEGTYEKSCVPIRRILLPNTKLVERKQDLTKYPDIQQQDLVTLINETKEITSPHSISILLTYCQKVQNNDKKSTSSEESSNLKYSHNHNQIVDHVFNSSEQFQFLIDAIVEGVFLLTLSNINDYNSLLSSMNSTDTKSHTNVKPICSSVVITISLTPYAFESCTPTNLPKSPPISFNKIFKSSLKGRPYYVAKLLQAAMGSIFPNSVLEDVARLHYLNNLKTNNLNDTANDNDSTRDETITAKNIYNVVDNAHEKVWAKSKTNVSIKIHNTDEESIDKRIKNIDGFLPILRIYQEEAVKWMLQREKISHKNRFPSEGKGSVPDASEKEIKIRDFHSNEDRSWELLWIVLIFNPSTTKTVITPLYEHRQNQIKKHSMASNLEYQNSDFLHSSEHQPKEYLQMKDELRYIYYSPFTGWLTKDFEDARKYTSGKCGEDFPSEVSGGILADSMGLGKTVEVLACILSHRYPNSLKHSFSSHMTGRKVENNIESIENLNTNFVPSSSFTTQSKKGRNDIEDVACICGRNTLFPSSLSWVRCNSCHEPMHGKCAGFISESQIMEETVAGYCDKSRCPFCFALEHSSPEKRIKSRATLIITPMAILKQWEREIRRHTSSKLGLKVCIYPGVREICSGNGNTTLKEFNMQYIHPINLADADIVLMTFSSLMNELGHSGDAIMQSQRKELRKRKRYRVVPSPLTCIHWWRICLDEAQRVEAPTAASAKMALKLSSAHRWCVTGTPIGRGKLEDLYGLLLFLGVNPFRNRSLFRHCFDASHRGVMDRISHLLCNIFWRSTKGSKIVREQLGIPEQQEIKVKLQFSSVERHFYQTQLNETILAANTVGEKSSKLTKRMKRKAEIFYSHLHRLRAACCHPQVGSNGIGRNSSQKKNKATSISSGILTMDQILDRLIDDAKNKCEESQRIIILHSNVLACLYRLKVEARYRKDLSAFNVLENDKELLLKGEQIYRESLKLTDQNATPIHVVGEALVTGNKGFLCNRKIFRNGKASLMWNVDSSCKREVWARFDFEGPAKKITAIKVKPKKCMENLQSERLIPRECVLQVSNATVGGEFVDTLFFCLNVEMDNTSEEYEWSVFDGFRTNKSKSWRILVLNYHHERFDELQTNKVNSKVIVGLDVQLMEPSIATDDLQRLHILHNIGIILNSLVHIPSSNDTFDDKSDLNDQLWLDKRQNLEKESEKLESLYMAVAYNLHKKSQHQFNEATKERKKIENELKKLRYNTNDNLSIWWNDLLGWCKIYGSNAQKDSICEIVKRDLFDVFGDNIQSQMRTMDLFPEFETVDGLNAALKFWIQSKKFVSDFSKSSCINDVGKLSSSPSGGEIIENSKCHKCRKDWHQTGPKCRHCKLEERLLDTEKSLVDPIIMCVLKSLAKWLKDSKQTTSNNMTEEQSKFLKSLAEMSTKYFTMHIAMKKEISRAKLAWRTHFDLLSDIDELNQCKRSMRLPYENEDLTKLRAEEVGSVVDTCDFNALEMEHTAKQAMALAELKRNKQSLRFLRNQSCDIKNNQRNMNDSDKNRNESSKEYNDDNEDNPVCAVCLSPFGNENQAVLACGHSFHFSPCIESIMSRNGHKSSIVCPMRCNIVTKKEDIMIANNIYGNDSDSRHIQRNISGSWGTKVDRLVGDIMDVIDQGGKSVVFSQWDDMLTIVEKALNTNEILFVRAKGARKFGEIIRIFRTKEYPVLLLNVKNGAEGLTLVEATHVFMIEPLLNCGLDMQAINRVHRIGQKSKTYVHRYIVCNTIEEKIDKLRMQRQENQIEGEVESNKNNLIAGGGIDGGFSHDELHEILS